jgi:hypothetical protein
MPIDCLGEIMFERTNVSPHMAIFEVLPVTLSGRRLLRLAAKGSNPPELHVPTSEVYAHSSGTRSRAGCAYIPARLPHRVEYGVEPQLRAALAGSCRRLSAPAVP